MNVDFWTNILRPIPSRTPVTPTLSVLKLVTPLALVLSTWAKAPVNTYLFLLAAAPVVLVLLQIAYLTVCKLETLQSEPHHEKMKELEGLYGDNRQGKRKQGRVSTAGRSGNPHMETLSSQTIDAAPRIGGTE